MKRKHKIMIGGLAVVAILIAAVATTAFAASKATAPEAPATVQAAPVGVTPVATPTDADYQAWGCPVANGNHEAIAKLLGITPQELEAQLEQGKSLVEIAAAKGVSEDKLVAAIFAPMKEFMQQQVTSGAWTQAQMDSHLKLAEQHVRQFVNAKGNSGSYGGCGAGGGMMGGWGPNGTTSNNPGGTNSSGSFRRGGMMGGNYGGMMGGYGGMMGGSYGGRTGGGFGGMMGGWY